MQRNESFLIDLDALENAIFVELRSQGMRLEWALQLASYLVAVVKDLNAEE